LDKTVHDITARRNCGECQVAAHAVQVLFLSNRHRDAAGMPLTIDAIVPDDGESELVCEKQTLQMVSRVFHNNTKSESCLAHWVFKFTVQNTAQCIIAADARFASSVQLAQLRPKQFD
jgi:hypothetical protein